MADKAAPVSRTCSSNAAQMAVSAQAGPQYCVMSRKWFYHRCRPGRRLIRGR